MLVYPLLGMVLRLAQQTRDRRLKQARHPPTEGRDHADLGKLLAGSVVGIVLIAEAVVIASKHPPAAFEGGGQRMGLLLLVLVGSGIALAALWRVKRPAYRASFGLLCWAGVAALGLQPEVFRLSDNPSEVAFWQSHFWGGIGLTGLMLFSVTCRPEICKHLRWRRLHVSANALAGLIFLAQGVSGSRDLLEIPLSWQKPPSGAGDQCATSSCVVHRLLRLFERMFSGDFSIGASRGHQGLIAQQLTEPVGSLSRELASPAWAAGDPAQMAEASGRYLR